MSKTITTKLRMFAPDAKSEPRLQQFISVWDNKGPVEEYWEDVPLVIGSETHSEDGSAND